MGGSVVTSCPLDVLLSTFGIVPGLCARERATKTDKNLPVLTHQTGVIQRNREIVLSYLAGKKNTLRARHASYCAGIDLKPQPQVLDGLPVSMYLGFWLKVEIYDP